MPWVGVSARYPQMSARAGRKIQLSDRINDCFERNLNAPGIDPAGRDMLDIVAYMTWLSKGIAAGGIVVGQGVDVITALTPDTAAGAKLFAKECAQCHGSGGSPRFSFYGATSEQRTATSGLRRATSGLRRATSEHRTATSGQRTATSELRRATRSRTRPSTGSRKRLTFPPSVLPR